MSLLYEIQAAATGTDVPVEVLLRKVLILATRLGHEPMKEWVTHELDGYPDGVQLPPYRAGYPTLLKGNFMNAAWQATGHVVPMTALPEGLRDLETKMDFREGVGRVREMAEQAKDGVLRMAAPPGLNAYVRLYEGMQCTSLWIETSAGALTNIMEQVRNRVLAFALEIEQANPLAGEDSGGGNGGPIPEATVAQIYNTTIYGGVNAVAAGSGSASQAVEISVQFVMISPSRRPSTQQTTRREEPIAAVLMGTTKEWCMTPSRVMNVSTTSVAMVPLPSGSGYGLGGTLLVLIRLGARFASALFDRERLITGTK